MKRFLCAAVVLLLTTATGSAADESGIDVLHAFAEEELGVLHRLLGFRRLTVGEPTWVSVADPSALAGYDIPECIDQQGIWKAERAEDPGIEDALSVDERRLGNRGITAAGIPWESCACGGRRSA